MLVNPENDKLKLTALKIQDGTVPDVSGMGASDALYLLESSGMKVKMNGLGRVVRQSPKAGEQYKEGQTIYIELG